MNVKHTCGSVCGLDVKEHNNGKAEPSLDHFKPSKGMAGKSCLFVSLYVRGWGLIAKAKYQHGRGKVN